MFIDLLFLFFIIKAEQSLSVGSYNIQNMRHLEKLQSDFYKLSQQIDIIGLQEVMTSDRTAHVMKSLFSVYKYSCVERVNLTDGELWESQAILSHKPILRCGAKALQATGRKKRVVQWAVLQSEDETILFLNTDHETHRWLWLGPSDRRQQLLSLRHHLETCEQWLEKGCQSWVTVVLGDFNTSGVSLMEWKTSREEIENTKQTLDLLTHVTACRGDTATFDSFFGSYELDHIFLKNTSSSCRETLQTEGSDHRAIFARITF